MKNTKSMKHLDLQVRLIVYANDNLDDATFGKGIATLLRGVENLGSLNAAAKNIHMAYSKAWRIVNDTEEGFGFSLISRDGARGSTLTSEGKKLLQAYEELEVMGTELLSAKFKEAISS